MFIAEILLIQHITLYSIRCFSLSSFQLLSCLLVYTYMYISFSDIFWNFIFLISLFCHIIDGRCACIFSRWVGGIWHGCHILCCRRFKEMSWGIGASLVWYTWNLCLATEMLKLTAATLSMLEILAYPFVRNY